MRSASRDSSEDFLRPSREPVASATKWARFDITPAVKSLSMPWKRAAAIAPLIPQGHRILYTNNHLKFAAQCASLKTVCWAANACERNGDRNEVKETRSPRFASLNSNRYRVSDKNRRNLLKTRDGDAV